MTRPKELHEAVAVTLARPGNHHNCMRCRHCLVGGGPADNPSVECGAGVWRAQATIRDLFETGVQPARSGIGCAERDCE